MQNIINPWDLLSGAVWGGENNLKFTTQRAWNLFNDDRLSSDEELGNAEGFGDEGLGDEEFEGEESGDAGEFEDE